MADEWWARDARGELVPLFPRSLSSQEPTTPDPEPNDHMLFDVMSRYANGQVPTVAITGQPWGLFSGPGYISDGLLDATEGTGSIYLEANLEKQVNKLGGRWMFDDVGGTRTGNGCTFVLVSWADGGIVANGTGRRTRCHLSITPTSAIMFVRDAENSGSVVNIGTRPLQSVLSKNTLYEAEVVLDGTTATLSLEGHVYEWTNTRLAPREGETFACYQCYYQNDGTDSRVRIAEVWADGGLSLQPSEGLFFALPNMDASDKLVLGHHFSPFPRTVNNAARPDYYENNWLAVNGESGQHSSFGGYVRDRPFSTPPYPGTWIETQWRQDIEDAKQGGLDGFFVNILGGSGANWNRYAGLAHTASTEYPGFWVVPMLDANGSAAAGDVATIADRIAHFANRPSAYYLPDGRYVIASFRTQFAGTNVPDSVAKWQQIVNQLSSVHGLNIAFIGVYNNIGIAGDFASIPQYAAGRWGPGADPGIWANHSNDAITTKARGEKHLAAVWPQDIRPRSNLFDEALNTGSLRASWERAIADDADLVQICTWSDFSEGSQVVPSAMHGHALLDIGAWYLARLKTGSFPTILRDALYVSHRNQMANATITGGQTSVMQHWVRPNRSAFREHVEILTFLVSPATITVRIGTTDHSYDAPAGMHVQTYPMQPGEVSTKAVRSGVEIARVNSPVVIKSSTVNQDRGYAVFSSIRGTTDQYDPTPGSPSPNPANYLP